MKKTLTAITLALLLTVGASFAHAGIIITDSPVNNNNCEAEKDGGIVKDMKEVIEEIFGIIITDSPVADDAQCKEESDKTGIIITD